MSIEHGDSSHSDDDENLVFLDEDEALSSHSEVVNTNRQNAWKVMLVDDEQDVHQITTLSLRDFNFENRNITFINAFSGNQAKQLIRAHPDTALIFLDVIMETKEAGLEVVRYIRETLSNQSVRIVLRTGQPGQVPEKTIMVDYDIDDYKTKTELTAQKLFTTVVSALRTFRHLTTIEAHRQELAQLVKASVRFVPHEFLRVLGKNSIVDIHLGDQVQQDMTLLISDLRSFTTLSETMTPQQTLDFINAFLSIVGPIIRTHNGFVIKHMGDGMMAVFPHQVDDALTAAIAMMQALAACNSERRQTGAVAFDIGIAIHSGNTMLGAVGDQERIQADLLSDNVNLAWRLERLTKLFGAPIMISQQSLTQVAKPSLFQTRSLGQVKVKGRKASITVLEVLNGNPADIMDIKLNTKIEFEKGLQFYYQGEFTAAAALFGKVNKSHPGDKAAKLYLQRSNHYIAYGGPDDWIGIDTTSDAAEG